MHTRGGSSRDTANLQKHRKPTETQGGAFRGAFRARSSRQHRWLRRVSRRLPLPLARGRARLRRGSRRPRPSARATETQGTSSARGGLPWRHPTLYPPARPTPCRSPSRNPRPTPRPNHPPQDRRRRKLYLRIFGPSAQAERGSQLSQNGYHRNSGTLPLPKGFLYQSPYRTKNFGAVSPIAGNAE